MTSRPSNKKTWSSLRVTMSFFDGRPIAKARDNLVVLAINWYRLIVVISKWPTTLDGRKYKPINVLRSLSLFRPFIGRPSITRPRCYRLFIEPFFLLLSGSAIVFCFRSVPPRFVLSGVSAAASTAPAASTRSVGVGIGAGAAAGVGIGAGASDADAVDVE